MNTEKLHMITCEQFIFIFSNFLFIKELLKLFFIYIIYLFFISFYFYLACILRTEIKFYSIFFIFIKLNTP